MDQITRVPNVVQVRDSRPWIKHYPSHVPTSLVYPDAGMPWLLERAATNWPDRLACIYYDERITYSRMLSRARRLALWLVENGIQPGDRIGILLPNVPEYISCLHGIWMAGGIAVALSPLCVPEEAEAFVAATQCRVIITLDVLSPLICQEQLHSEFIVYSSLANRVSRLERLGYAWVRLMRLGLKGVCPAAKTIELRQILRESRRKEDGFTPVPTHSRDKAYILATGGTTRAPKAVTLTHGNLLANALQISHWAGGEIDHEVLLAVLPFFHSYGLSTCLTTGTALGATLILHHRFRTASVLRLMQEHQPTIFPAVPAMLAALNPLLEKNSNYRIERLKSVISGGSALSPAVGERFAHATGAAVVEGYGLSEASPVTHAGPLDGTAISGTIGLPLPDTDARIVDANTGVDELPRDEVGELIVRGPQVMEGYWNAPEATADAIRNGWLYTGDLATCDHQGFFRIVDRKKDLIITSGFNVYPVDVEEVLLRYPGIREVAVVGVPDEIKGEVVKAIVVMKSGSLLNPKDFNEFTKLHLAAHKRPRVYEERKTELPRNFLGKILRRELRSETGTNIPL